ncbi:NodT family efflux transporter outer membrane factor (OMF) lipoprotein [Sphingomonas kaistensis]|uniref:NodT family efflux transporter outer membrane factor (OMF) lipoprotein n=1 Tax=Sphingomonas kaistensis TaxID=298708 RepID=A0A7X6BGE3_9SPHN|nr:efflux transporter outer membrane subunit [Sphingomonas kaistensis]NJC06369.1 NodT family efflux transporter outer membrane factor (OMF) lipoprotein [Sphingomonas kaistensis]
MTQRLLLIAASALALAACASGPNYAARLNSATAEAPFLGAGTPLVSAAQPAGDWWRLYRDPVLDGLVADALSANTDVRVAVGRLQRARALVRQSRAAREPQIGASAGAQVGRSPQAIASGQDGTDLQLDAGLSVAYEVDLAGRIGRSIEAARGDAAAAAFEADAVRVLVVADTTRAYADAAAAAERIAVAQRIVGLLDRSLALTERRRVVGLATGLDTARIAALRDQRQAEVPLLEAERTAALLQLATLTGRAPRDLPAVAAARTDTLALDSPIPVGDGAGLLARRPDVRAAERRLAAATARIGVATADLYPSISLGGSVGGSGTSVSNLFNPVSWLVGPLLNWTVNRSATRARIAAAEADSQVALAQFDGSILTALQETETALSAYQRAQQRRTALASARTQAEAVVRRTRALQREGQISSLELLDAERTFADAEATLAEGEARIVSAQIDLFRALGGNWQG